MPAQGGIQPIESFVILFRSSFLLVLGSTGFLIPGSA
jgi:hypothetical protein